MTPLISAGLLMYSFFQGNIRYFIVHPGGPFFKNKNEGYWSLPKGLINRGEDHFNAAIREFHEETGIVPASASLNPFPNNIIDLGSIKYKSGKTIYAWAFESTFNPDIIIDCNLFTINFFGIKKSYPECDIGKYCDYYEAKILLKPAQLAFLERINSQLKISIP